MLFPSRILFEIESFSKPVKEVPDCGFMEIKTFPYCGGIESSPP